MEKNLTTGSVVKSLTPSIAPGSEVGLQYRMLLIRHESLFWRLFFVRLFDLVRRNDSFCRRIGYQDLLAFYYLICV